MPLDIQIQACAQGLIPYVPAMRRDELASPGVV
jgi:hypothetical protein